MRFLFITIFVMLALSAGIASCSPDNPEPVPAIPPEKPGDNDTTNGGGNNNSMQNRLRLTAGSVSFTITLENNAAAKAFKALLPITVNMSEMNSNEKYYYLPESLPTATSNPGTIRTGDLVLYGSSCVVLFYKTFSTSYNYTYLGRMANPSGLASALGTGNVSVTFEQQEVINP